MSFCLQYRQKLLKILSNFVQPVEKSNHICLCICQAVMMNVLFNKLKDNLPLPKFSKIVYLPKLLGFSQMPNFILWLKGCPA